MALISSARSSSVQPFWPVLLALMCWGGVAWSGATWGWRLWAQAPVQPVKSSLPENPSIDVRAVARLLGERADSEGRGKTTNVSRHQLMGVVRDASGQGVAMIATDGAPARPYRLGGALEGDQVIRSIRDKEVRLGPAGNERGLSDRPGLEMVLSLKP